MAKVVVITGASSGIGKATAIFLAQKGYTVYGTSRIVQLAKNLPFNYVVLEVSDSQSIARAITEVLSKENRIDVLINNAGKGIIGAIEDTPTATMQAAFNTNFFGAIEVTKAVLPQMRQQQSGLVINITSIAGYMGLPFRGGYSASKGALALATEAMRMEVKDFGIRLTTLAPGDVRTNIALGRYQVPLTTDSRYKKNYGNILNLIDNQVNKGMYPIKVAKKIEKIIRLKNPKIHYSVAGKLEKLSIVLKKILPDKWYEKLLINHYKL